MIGGVVKKKIDFSVRMGMLLSSAYRLIRNIVFSAQYPINGISQSDLRAQKKFIVSVMQHAVVYALEGRHSVCNEVICPGDAVGAASDTVIEDNDLLRQIV